MNYRTTGTTKTTELQDYWHYKNYRTTGLLVLQKLQNYRTTGTAKTTELQDYWYYKN